MLLIIIIVIFCAEFIFSKVLEYLNNKNRSLPVPKELEGLYDEATYKKSQEYHKEKDKLSSFSSVISFIGTLVILVGGGIGYIDSWVRMYIDNEVIVSLAFFSVLFALSSVLSLPFEYYDTFVIEQKYGFNKSTIGIFIADKIKSLLLAIVIGGGLGYFIIKIYYSFPSDFWWITWAVVSAFMMFIMAFYASVIVPLFNKLTPLPDGDLKTAIQEYCSKVNFKLTNVFVIDGSKRSTKANAFFSGLGASKKIVLYDTLIQKQSIQELVAVLAHEVGHYKHKHTRTSLVITLINTGVTFYLMSLLLGNPILAESLGATKSSFHIDILVFFILYSPLSMLTGFAMNIISRKNEYEADAYAAKTFSANDLASALKKLTLENLSNLTPHPAYVWVHYSHPTVDKRIKELMKKPIV